MKERVIYIILPAYNEEEALPPLLGAIRESMSEAGIRYKVLVSKTVFQTVLLIVKRLGRAKP
jgi:hypothetical protein